MKKIRRGKWGDFLTAKMIGKLVDKSPTYVKYYLYNLKKHLNRMPSAYEVGILMSEIIITNNGDKKS